MSDVDGFREARTRMQQEWMESAKQCEWIGDITMEEVNQHNTKKDMWVVFNGFVYDMTQYIFKHPGGTNCFMPPYKKDITQQFMAIHPYVDPKLIEKLKIGKLVSSK